MVFCNSWFFLQSSATASHHRDYRIKFQENIFICSATQCAASVSALNRCLALHVTGQCELCRGLRSSLMSSRLSRQSQNLKNSIRLTARYQDWFSAGKKDEAHNQRRLCDVARVPASTRCASGNKCTHVTSSKRKPRT